MNYISFEEFYRQNQNLFKDFNLTNEEINKIVISLSDRGIDLDKNNEELVKEFKRLFYLALPHYRDAQLKDKLFDEKIEKFKNKPNKTIKQLEKMEKEIKNHVSAEKILSGELYGFFKNVYSSDDF